MHDTTNISPWQPQRRKAKKNTSVACLKIDTKKLVTSKFNNSYINLFIRVDGSNHENSVEDEVEPCVHISKDIP